MIKNDNLELLITESNLTSTNNILLDESSININDIKVEPTVSNSGVFTMAKAFLLIESMSHKKLQKLCYYAKAWYLALYDSNIISDNFEAWVHGAVNPDLYNEYKRYGFSNIPSICNANDIPEEFISFAEEIYNSYGHLDGDQLEAINHKEMPWIKARGNCKSWEHCRNIISEEDMKIYYRGMMEKNA